MPFVVDFYEDESGSAPVEEFLDGLSKKPRAKMVARIKLLEEQGVKLPFPYSSQVEGRIRELRARFAKERLRILYFADSQRSFILLHGIVKRADKLEETDIRIARERMMKHEEKIKGKRK